VKIAKHDGINELRVAAPSAVLRAALRGEITHSAVADELQKTAQKNWHVQGKRLHEIRREGRADCHGYLARQTRDPRGRTSLFGRTTPMMKELRKGLPIYAKKERATVKAAARVNVGENGTIIFSSDAAPWEKAMVRTTPMWRAMNGPARNDNAANK